MKRLYNHFLLPARQLIKPFMLLLPCSFLFMMLSELQAATITGIGGVVTQGGSTLDSIQNPVTNAAGQDQSVAAGVTRNRIGNPFFEKTFRSNDPIDIAFNTQNSAGGQGPVTEYRFFERVNNRTGTTWTDFHFQLGFGTGNGFMQMGGDDGLDFDFNTDAGGNLVADNNPRPTATTAGNRPALPNIGQMPDDLTFTATGQGNTVPNGGFIDFTFAIDVPDGLANNQFTLRERPTTNPIPEPSSLLLLGSGLVGLLGYVRKRIAMKARGLFEE